VTFESMDASKAVIADIPNHLAHGCFSALAGLLQVTVEVNGVGYCCDGPEKQPEQPEDEAAYADNVFELTFPDTVEDTSLPYQGLAEVIPIKPKQIQVSPEVCLWETLFAKPAPVRNLAEWFLSRESDGFIYIPNDLSLAEGAQESYLHNAEYTQVMLFAYQKSCVWKKIDPEITLQDGRGPFRVMSLDPMSGVQQHVQGEKAARLANSTLKGEDNDLIPLFLAMLQAMGPDDYLNPVAHLTVLAKAELTLTGESSLVTNHTVVSNLCRFVEAEFSRPGSFMLGNSIILNAVLFTLRQMVVEGLVLHQSKDHFMACMYRAKLDQFKQQLSNAYDEACSCR